MLLLAHGVQHANVKAALTDFISHSGGEEKVDYM